MKKAPILVTVHTRFDHFKNCIDSLIKCPEAKYSHLFVSSDFQRNDEEKVKVDLIRNYIRTIKGFKSVTPIFFKKNVGIDYASHYSVNKVFENYDQIIMLEDDIEVSPFFLNYINQGLDFYKNDSNIYSICGFSPYIFSNNYEHEESKLFKSNRWNAWGFGFWKKKFITFEDFRKSKFFFKYLEEDLKSKHFRKKINKLSKEYFPHLLYSLKKNKMPEYDFLTGYYCLKNDLYNIYFTKTHTINKGNDGSGLRAERNDVLASRMCANNFIKKSVDFRESNKIVFINDMPRPPAKSIILKLKIVLIQLNIFDFTKKLIKQLKF
jgi:hypothetical protein